MPALATAVLIIASILSSISATLMLRGSLRSRTAEGLALTMLVLNLLGAPLWLAYAAANHNPLQFATSLLWTVVLASWWGYWATDRGRSFWPIPALIAAWTITLTVLAFTAVPFPVFGWIAGVVGVFSSVPQLVHLIRARELGEGFHLTAWLISGGSLTMWTLYGLFAHEAPILIPDAIALGIILAIAARSVFLHRRSARIATSMVVHPAMWDPDLTGPIPVTSRG